MPKAATKEPEVQENVEEEVEETETKAIRPNDLAEELGVDGKRIRAFLRSNFTRPDESKNTNWDLDEDMVMAVRERFAPSDEDEEGDEDSDSDES